MIRYSILDVSATLLLLKRQAATGALRLSGFVSFQISCNV